MLLLLLITILMCITSNLARNTNISSSLRDIDDLDKKWHKYVKTYKEFYNDLEEDNEERKKLFEERIKEIEKWNEEYEEGRHSVPIGESIFTAMSSAERKKMFKHPVYKQEYIANIDAIYRFRSAIELPERVDWREKGVVTDVKFQGKCSACYAFSVVDALAAQYAIKTRELVPLSAQMIIDCTLDRNDGCDGGYVRKSFNYIIEQNGIATDKEYPFTKKVGKCHEDLKNKKYTLKKFVVLPEGDEEALKEAVAEIGPIAVAIDADLESFEDYTGKGIFDNPDCKSENVTHTGLLVGYGTEKGVDYWIVKNNWSELWGDKGYIKVRRNNNNRCGVASFAVYPVI